MDWYLTLKTVHLIALISWMAGLFYLPRLFVYHAMEEKNSGTSSVFQIMEKRLFNIIMMPAMILSLASGLFLVMMFNVGASGWLHLKLLCVGLLVLFQWFLNHCRKQLALGLNQKSPKFFRMINEIPTVLLVIIIICVVFKPF